MGSINPKTISYALSEQASPALIKARRALKGFRQKTDNSDNTRACLEVNWGTVKGE
jgi:hypothetical protein